MPRKSSDPQLPESNKPGDEAFGQEPMGGTPRYKKGRVTDIRYPGSKELSPVKWNRFTLLPDEGKFFSRKLLEGEIEKMKRMIRALPRQDVEYVRSARTVFFDGNVIEDSSEGTSTFREGILSVVPGRGFAHSEAISADGRVELASKDDRTAYRITIETPIVKIIYRLDAHNPKVARVLNELFVESFAHINPVAGIYGGIVEMEQTWSRWQEEQGKANKNPNHLIKIHEERLR